MPPRPLQGVLNEYAAKKLRRTDPSTKKKFEIALKHWGTMVGHEPSTDDLRDDAVEEFQDTLIELNGLTEDTAQTYTKKVLALWRFARELRYVDHAPMVEVITPAEHIPIAWLKPELKRLFEALGEETGFIGGVPAAEWWLSLHWVLWDTWERIGAVLQLPWSHVSLESEAPYLWFAAKTRKGKKSPKGHALHALTAEALRKIVEPKRELVFPWPYNRMTLWNRYRRLIADAGLPCDRYHMFHCMRRAGASHMKAAGGDPGDTLGHSDPKVTKRYLDPRICPPISPSTMLFRPIG
jgi:integrase